MDLKTSWYCTRAVHMYKWNKREIPKMAHKYMLSWFFTKVPRASSFQKERTVFQTRLLETVDSKDTVTFSHATYKDELNMS
jgi:hypothetical protein